MDVNRPLETPCLLIDLDTVKRNISAMQKFCDERGLKFRPHIKTHKVPALAKLQIEAGASGITCQKIGEAEVMAAAGITDIMIYYNIIGSSKLERLMKLAGEIALSVVADAEVVVRGLGEAAQAHGVKLKVFVDCDTGFGRTGVVTQEEALALAKLIHSYENLEFGGLSTYPYSDSSEAWFGRAMELFRGAGLDVPAISAGGSAYPTLEGPFKLPTELRAGTYIYTDWSMVKTGLATQEQCALRVVATVVNRPRDNFGILDAGSKALTSDFGYMKDRDAGYGHIVEYPEAKIYALSEEHGHVDFSACRVKPQIGETVTIIPNHVCGTVNMHDAVYVAEGGKVAAQWVIPARGKLT